MPKAELTKAGNSLENEGDSSLQVRQNRRSLVMTGFFLCVLTMYALEFDTVLLEASKTYYSYELRSAKDILNSTKSSDFKEGGKSFCRKVWESVRVDPVTQRKAAHGFVTNSGHLLLLMNSLASIQKVDPTWPSIVFGLDDNVCPQLEEQYPDLAASTNCIPYVDRVLRQMERDEPKSYEEYVRVNKSISDAASWGSAMHKVLINSKLYMLRDILHCDLDAFITDTDIVFLKDPWEYFPSPEKNITTDIISQCDTNPRNNLLDMNSGFMWWKNTPQNKNLSQSLVKDMTWWAIDQGRVNNLLYDKKIPITLLPKELFPNGAVLAGMAPMKKLNAVAIHANWNGHFDEKTTTLKKHGFWYLKD